MRIELDRADGTYRTGEPLGGTVRIVTREGDACRAVRLLRYWRTRGRGDEDVGGRFMLDIHEGRLEGPPPYRIPFRIEAPQGPLTYDGALVGIDHYVEVRLDLATGVGALATQRFFLDPSPEMAAPHPDLVRVTGSRARRRHGCRMAVGALLVLFGILTLPLGVVLLALGLFLLLPVIRRGVAGTKLGEVSSHTDTTVVEPGRPVRIEIRMDPLKRREIEGITATLRAREICANGKGRERKVHEHELHSRTVKLSGPRTLEAGQETVLSAEIPVPRTRAWTFAAANNEVTWDVTVHVDIPSWPDWYEEHKLVVWPPTATGAKAASSPRKRRGLLEGGAPAEAPDLAPAPGREKGERPAERKALESEMAGLLEGLARESATSITASDPEDGGVLSDPPGPAPAEPPAVPELAARVRAILEERSLAGARDRLTRDLVGETFSFGLEVESVKRTFGAGPAARYRKGRTVTGTVAGTDVRVEVRFPDSLNPELDRVSRGAVLDVTASVADWQKLSGQPVLQA